MDFLTGMAYWGILVLVMINAMVVTRMKVEVYRETGSGARDDVQDQTEVKEN